MIILSLISWIVCIIFVYVKIKSKELKVEIKVNDNLNYYYIVYYSTKKNQLFNRFLNFLTILSSII